jgi:hypothetical protein
LKPYVILAREANTAPGLGQADTGGKAGTYLELGMAPGYAGGLEPPRGRRIPATRDDHDGAEWRSPHPGHRVHRYWLHVLGVAHLAR